VHVPGGGAAVCCSAVSSPPEIRFYFDYESPNAYLAWTQLPALARRHGAGIEPVPVLYAALLEANHQRGPGESPPKGRWMMKNVARKAAVLEVPLAPPAHLPFNPLLALRVTLLVAKDSKYDATGVAVIDALFRAVWARGLHVSEPEVVQMVLDELELPGAALVRATQDPEVKERLRAQTAEAVKQGVFGVPTMIVGEELFWGYDDFAQLELVLAGTDPLRGNTWAALPTPSAMRRRIP